MSELLAVPLKKPNEVNVTQPLKNLIQSSYNANDANAVDSDTLAAFSKLRNVAIWKVFEKTDSALEVICR